MTKPIIRPRHAVGRRDRTMRHGRRAHVLLRNPRGGLFAVAAVGLVLTIGAAAPAPTNTAPALPTVPANAVPAFPLIATLPSSVAPLPPVLPPAASATPALLARPVPRALLTVPGRFAAAPVLVAPPRVSTARRAAAPALRKIGPTYVGRASWYGPGFQGRRTANGERFNTHALTAAHKSLPFGTRLRVCRANKCVVVRVNDRGPYIRGRFLDLSMRAAVTIGVTSRGVATVTATVVAPIGVPSKKSKTWTKPRRT